MGFSTKKGSPARQRRPLGRAMRERRHADVERVERIGIEHRIRIRIGAGAEARGGLAGPVLRGVGESDDLDVLEGLQHAEVTIRDAARADEADARPGFGAACHAISSLLVGCRVEQPVVDRSRVRRHAPGREALQIARSALRAHRA